MCGAGLWLAGGASLAVVIAALVGTGLTVASANSLNMVLERDVDKLMPRTATRPLPAGRMSAGYALTLGAVAGTVGLTVLYVLVNAMTAVLGAIALVGYVAVYTPLKRRTPLALVIGAVPGAMPPLMGWTAVTGTIDAPGLVLFAVLFVWQIPHFIAIAVRREQQYLRAGMKTVNVVRGTQVAKMQALAYATTLVPISLLLIPLSNLGWIYLLTSLAAGIWFWAATLQGFGQLKDQTWAKRVFGISLIYLPVWMLGLCLDITLL